MVTGSINTNISALYGHANLGRSSQSTEASVARLSSGNRIIRASDDVAGLAVGTGLKTDVSTLRTALTNASQANSLLSVADGALSGIGDILQRQKALSSQANSGSISDTQRAYLDQEFQNLSKEIDRISTSTNFNGIKLIDGGLDDVTSLEANATGTKASGTITISTNPSDNDTVLINGTTFTFTTAASVSPTTVTIGGSAGSTLDNLLAKLQSNTSSSVSAATYAKVGSGNTAQIVATYNEAGRGGNSFTLANGTGTGLTFSAAALQGGSDNSLVEGGVTSTGTVADSILSSLSATQASAAITFAGTPADGNTLIVNGETITFKATLTGAANEVLVGATQAESIDNLVSVLNNSDKEAIAKASYSHTAGSAILNVTYKGETTDGNSFVVVDGSGTPIGTAVTTLSGGAVGGVDTNLVKNNSAFAGKISGFTAEYAGLPDQANVSVKIGDYTYKASITDTTATSNTFVTFTADNAAGGSFSLQLAANQGQSVNNQSEADVLANRLNKALEQVTFYQNRTVSSFSGTGNILDGTVKTGTLNGAFLELNRSSFDALEVDSVKVSGPRPGSSDLKIQISINGQTYETANGIGNSIVRGSRLTLTNVEDPTSTLTFVAGGITGDTTDDINVSTDSEAAAFQDALSSAFGIGEGGGGINFQVGIAASDVITVSLSSAKTSALYNGESLNVLSVDSAVTAGQVLDDAISQVTSLRASIGALQSRFDFASANLETSIQNTDAARADFLDANVAEESTKFAQSQVRMQASISVIAQANQLPQSLLKLIG